MFASNYYALVAGLKEYTLDAENKGFDAKEILDEMIAADAAEEAAKADMAAAAKGDSLLQRKYVIPFVLAVIVLACTQATGINSVLNYSVKIFQQAAGLEVTGIADNDTLVALYAEDAPRVERSAN